MTPNDSAVPELASPVATVAASQAAPTGKPAAAPAADSSRSTNRSAGRSDGRPPRRGAGDRRDMRPVPKSDPARGSEARPARQHPVLDQLASLYPALFGETLLPLKRGIFQDLLEAQPGVLDKDGLKAALALHTRSSRYLTAVAAGLQRHDLAGQPVEDLTPEQVHHALIEVFRRRGSRSREDLRPKLRQRILKAFEASGLSREDYALRTLGRDEEVNQLTRDALAEAAVRAARDEALLRTFEASGQTVEAFADMYGLPVLEAQRTLMRVRARQATQAGPAASTDTTATPASTPNPTERPPEA